MNSVRLFKELLSSESFNKDHEHSLYKSIVEKYGYEIPSYTLMGEEADVIDWFVNNKI